MKKTVLRIMNSAIRMFAAISILCVIAALPAHAEKIIRVGLAEGQSTVSLSSSSVMKISGKSGVGVSGKRALAFSVSGRSIVCGGRAMVPPIIIRSASPIVYDKRPYLGSFSLILNDGGITVVDSLGIESYLRGVLKMEANPNWPMEALKVQAIISRTYALRQIGRHGSNGYDVCADPHCQAYRGINAHDSTTDKAISATKGMVVTYKGSLAKTFFHSDSGGQTTAASEVWGEAIPYLQSVKDPVPSGSPYTSWTATLDGVQLGNALAKAGYSVGSVTDMKINSLDRSGRVSSLTIFGTRGARTISGHRFRMAVGSRTVKSTAFKIIGSDVVSSYPIATPEKPPKSDGQLSPDEEKLLMILTKQGAFSSDELISMLMDPSRKREFLEKKKGGSYVKRQTSPMPSPRITSGGQKGTFTLEGRGWGHGVGLSQWGARALALSGWNAKRIIEHYYPGAVVTSIRH